MDLNIAVCEDDDIDFQALEACLHSVCDEWDLTSRIARFFSGEEFLATLGKIPPDIIFMDIYLNGISGMEAARDTRLTGQSRFIFTTSSREHALEAFTLNAAHYLLKPLTKEAVREALRRCLPRPEENFPKLLEVKTSLGNFSPLKS